MNSSKPIGGFLELELRKGMLLHQDGVLLNSGRACFEYLLRVLGPSKVYLPKFTCDAMTDTLQRMSVNYSFYSINSELEIANDITLNANEYVIYNNYFGIKDKYSARLVDFYGEQLILDSSQAYFMTVLGKGSTFYSCRKFFGVPDGGCLYTHSKLNDKLPKGMSYMKAEHLLKRIDLGPEAAYEEYKRNEDQFSNTPMCEMSELTQRILENVDYQEVVRIRNENFTFLNDAIGHNNKLKIAHEDINGPLCYPYWTNDATLRRKFIENKIFLPMYWPNVLEWADEGELERDIALNLLPIPVDQRYGKDEMKRIIGVINE